MSDKITRDEVRHVAKLARLELSEGDELALTGQMNNILAYMDTLNQLDTTDVPPTTHAIQLQNVFRPDEVHSSLDRTDSLANAPETDRVSFIVPKVI